MGSISTMSPVLLGTVAATIAGLAAGVGALSVLFLKSVSERFMDTLLGFATGVILHVISDEIIPETHRRGY